MSDVTREQLRKYRNVIQFWLAKYNTQDIAEMTGLPEHLVARWVSNFRDLMRGGVAA